MSKYQYADGTPVPDEKLPDPKGAQMLKQAQQTPPATPRAAPSPSRIGSVTGKSPPASGDKSNLEEFSHYMFGRPDPVRDVNYGRRAAEGAAFAGAVGAYTPWILRGLGTAALFVPGAEEFSVPAFEAAQEASMAMPIAGRAISAGAGGATTALIEGKGDEVGAPRAAMLPIEMLGGGAGEWITSKIGKLAKASIFAASGHPLSAFHVATGVEPGEKLKTAERLSSGKIGLPHEGYNPKAVSDESQHALKLDYAMKDPGYAAILAQNSAVTPHDYYMSQLGTEVDKVIAKGNLFSTSKQGADLLDYIETQHGKGYITAGERSELERRIKADQHPKDAVRRNYGVDTVNLARDWKGDVTILGKRSQGEHVAEEMKGEILDKFNSWTHDNGMGELERKVNGAYALQQRAKTLDSMNRLFWEYGKEGGDNKKIVNDLVRLVRHDPERAKGEMLASIYYNLKNLRVDEIPGRIKKLDDLLQVNDLMDYSELRQLRAAGDAIQRTLDTGRPPMDASRLAIGLLMRLGKTTGVNLSDVPAELSVGH